MLSLGDMFEKFQKSAKRLELLQEYNIEGQEKETFDNYIKGQVVTPYEELKEWNSLVKTWTSNGKTVERVRVIASPLSVYLKFEIELGYLPSFLFGQDVYFIDKIKYENLNHNKNNKDFWIFDDEYVFIMEYDENGKFQNSYQVEGDDYIKLYNSLKSNAISLDEFLVKYRDCKINIDL